MNPTHLGYRAVDSSVGKRWHRRTVDEMLVRLRKTLA